MAHRLLLDDDLDAPEPFEIVVCQGPPNCLLEDEEAVLNQMQGCPLCRRYRQNLDGTQTEYQLKAH